MDILLLFHFLLFKILTQNTRSSTLPNFRNTKELQASARPKRCRYQSIEKNELCSETAKRTGPMAENLAKNREDLTAAYPKAAPRQSTASI